MKELRSGTADYIATHTYGYDGYGNRISEKDGRGDETVYQYDSNGCDKRAPSAITLGKTSTYAGQTTTYSYDCVIVKPTTITDPNGAQSNIRYDEFGRGTKEWSPGDSETYPTVSYTYNWGDQAPIGTVVTTREQAGTTNVLTESEWFDGLGRQIQQRHERPGGSFHVEIWYDNEGHEDSQSLPCASTAAPDSYGSCTLAPLTTRYDYDFLGRVNQQWNPDNNTRTITYATSDRLVDEIDERGHLTRQRKDGLDRTTQVYEYPGTQGTGYGNPSTTSYTYDAADRLLQITDDAGNPIINGYDKMGRKTSMNDPDTGLWSYEYEDDGDFKSQTDPRGIKISMDYDSLGRLKSKAYSRNGQPISDAPAVTYTYDVDPTTFPNGAGMTATVAAHPIGRLTRVVDWAGEQLFNYDGRGRSVYERRVIGIDQYNIRRSYDSMDRETSTTYPGDNEQVNFHYNQQGLLDGVSSSLGTYLDQTGTSFNAAGQPNSLKLGNGKSTDFTYRTDLRLATIGVSPGALLGLSYPSYDEKGQIRTITDTMIAGQTNIQYDDFDRLQSASGTQASTYNYDNIGNMTVKAEGQAGGPNSTPETACSDFVDSDGDNLINDGCKTSYSSLCYSPQQSGCTSVASSRPHAVKTAAGNNPGFAYNPSFTATHTYDPDGNLLSITGANGTGGTAGSLGLLLRLEHLNDGYDAEGRLKKIEYNKLDFGGDLAFYDLTENCVIDISDLILVNGSWGSSVGGAGYNARYDVNSDGFVDVSDINTVSALMDKTCPQFIYDHSGQLIKLDGPRRIVYIGGIFEKNLDTQEVTKYYFGPDGRRIAMRKGSTLYYFAQDHLGGTALVMNSSGGVVSRMGYYPYGMTWTEQGVMPTDRLYTSQQRLGAKSGTYNYLSRFYSADIGRFPQPDSIIPDAFEPQSLSRYSYVSNNPTNYTDPSGHFGGGVYPVGPMPGGGGDPVSAPGNGNGDPTRPPQDAQPGWEFWYCSVWIEHTGPGAKLELESKFYFNYRTLVQDPPHVIPTDSGAAELKNVTAWNSRWSETVRFADARATEQLQLGEDTPYIPGVNMWYFHLWIQEDAWGNCEGHRSLHPKIRDLWPF